MSAKSQPEPLPAIETLQRTVDDYERRFRLLDGQMRVLEKERQKLSAVVNNTDAGFLVIGADLCLVWGNRVFPSLLNAESQTSMLGQPCNRVVCGSERICDICPAAQALRTGLVAHHEVRLDVEGITRHIYATSIPIKSPAGVVEETMVMLQDVSDLEVLLREKALVQLLQEVAVAANEATNIEEAMRSCLGRVCAYTGWPVGHVYTRSETGGDTLVPTRFWHCEDPGRYEALRRITEAAPMASGVGLAGRVLESGSAAWIADVTRAGYFPTAGAAADIGVKGGFAFPVMVGREVAAVLEFFSPEPAEPDARLLETMRHIGTQLGRVIERDRAGRALRLSEEQFRHAQKMEAVGRLAGGVAHDFNNLLTIITGHSELLISRCAGDDEVGRELEEIKRAASRAAALTRQLLAFSRKQVLQPRVIDLNAAVADMEKMLRRLIGEDIQLVTELGPDVGRVKADRGQIEQVIMNLVVNARDAMPSGGCITVQTAEVDLAEIYDGQHARVEPGRYVMLVVSDNGQGMDAETRARIFEPFFTTKELGKGTGLGLSTVYGILRQSGGYILVESEPMQGATFRIYLPRVAVEAASGVETRPGVPVSLAGVETVLLVEDELMVRRLTFDILSRVGYKVLEARDPADARLICEQYKGPIHLMLSDVVMPMMSGVELADCLRPLRPEMKILFMSGYTGENLASSAFIHKPFTPDGLAGKVREVLDTSSGI